MLSAAPHELLALFFEGNRGVHVGVAQLVLSPLHDGLRLELALADGPFIRHCRVAPLVDRVVRGLEDRLARLGFERTRGSCTVPLRDLVKIR